MTEETTKVTVLQPWKDGIGNLVLENARFFKRPNFSGEPDRFKNTTPSFTVVIPNEHADELRALGWNVKTLVPRSPEEEALSLLSVKAYYSADGERGPKVTVRQGDKTEALNVRTVGILDRSQVLQLDLEIRGWESEPDERPGQYTAALVELFAELKPSIIGQKHGTL